MGILYRSFLKSGQFFAISTKWVTVSVPFQSLHCLVTTKVKRDTWPHENKR